MFHEESRLFFAIDEIDFNNCKELAKMLKLTDLKFPQPSGTTMNRYGDARPKRNLSLFGKEISFTFVHDNYDHDNYIAIQGIGTKVIMDDDDEEDCFDNEDYVQFLDTLSEIEQEIEQELVAERSLALMMSMHTRLGNESHLASLKDQNLMRYILDIAQDNQEEVHIKHEGIICNDDDSEDASDE